MLRNFWKLTFELSHHRRKRTINPRSIHSNEYSCFVLLCWLCVSILYLKAYGYESLTLLRCCARNNNGCLLFPKSKSNSDDSVLKSVILQHVFSLREVIAFTTIVIVQRWWNKPYMILLLFSFPVARTRHFLASWIPWKSLNTWSVAAISGCWSSCSLSRCWLPFWSYLSTTALAILPKRC